MDDEAVIVILRDDADGLTPFSVIRLGVAGARIVRIVDYIKCPWILGAAESVAVEAG